MTGTAFTRLLGVRYPLQMASIGGLSSPALATAVSEAGGLGMLSGVAGVDDLVGQLREVSPGTVLGVGFLMPFLDRSAIEVAARSVRLVEFFYGDPDPTIVAQARTGGALCSWQVGSAEEARAAVDAGCDVVVAQGAGAGGHVRGTTPWRELLAQVRPIVEGPLVIGGGIGSAADVVSALASGADAVRIGTRFLAAAESPAHPDYAEALIGASPQDSVLTTAFGLGWPDAPHRVLRQCIEAGEAAGDDQRWTPDWPAVDSPGDPMRQALYAGTSVGAVTRRQTAAEIVAEMMSAD